MSTLVKGGTIVTAGDTYEADILIDNGIIALIGNFLEAQVDQVIDASGSYVLPGAVDAHTHLELSVSGTVSSDDFYTGTLAAACGGTTTIIDYADQVRGEPLAKGLEARLATARGKAVIDYGFHLVLTDYNARVAGEMAEMVSAGVSSFKCFLAYKGRSMIDDGTLLVLLSRSKDIGALTCVHCENGEVIDVLTRKLLSEGKTSTRYHPKSRPPEVEAEATGRAIALAEMALAPVYIVHLTTAQSLEKVRAARARGLTVYAETCPQYLLLSADKYDEPGFEAAKYVMSPPLRPRSHQGALWTGLGNGDIQVVATDHCPFNFKEQKELGREDFSRIPNGAPGIETRLCLLYTEGVAKGRISLNRFVDLVATAPAKLFGLYPKKGTIAVGSDADLVVWDPKVRHVLSVETLHQNVDYDPYEGFEAMGKPTVVMSRGKVIAKNGTFLGQAGAGEFLRRKPYPGVI